MKQKNIILMVVAVGCGLVAAFLTSQMSAKGRDEVEVVVAAKDIPVGTLITEDDLKTLVKSAKRPKEAVHPASVLVPQDLLGKRLTRAVRADETFNSQELSKGGIVTLPPGHHMVALQTGAANAVAGFVGPGSRVNVNATVRMGNRTEAFVLLKNMLIVAVDTQTQFPKDGAFPTLSTVSLAVKDEEARLLDLAKSRGCNLALMLINQEGKNQDDKSVFQTEEERKELVKENVKKLSEDKEQAKLPESKGSETGRGDGDLKPVPPVKPGDTSTPVAPTTPANPMGAPAAPTEVKPSDTVKVLIAKENLARNTEITTDLIKDKFEEKMLPRELATEAVVDLYQHRGKVLKNGLTKGFWITPDMIDFYQSPRDPGQAEVKPDATPANPTRPTQPTQPAQRNYHDVNVHSPSGTVVYRYLEVAPGKWKKVAELTPEQAARPTEAPKAAPPATEGEKKID